MSRQEFAQQLAETAGFRRPDIRVMSELLQEIPNFLLPLLKNPDECIIFEVTTAGTISAHESNVCQQPTNGLKGKADIKSVKNLPKGEYEARVELVSVVYPDSDGSKGRVGTAKAIIATSISRRPRHGSTDVNGFAWFHPDISSDIQ